MTNAKPVTPVAATIAKETTASAKPNTGVNIGRGRGQIKKQGVAAHKPYVPGAHKAPVPETKVEAVIAPAIVEVQQQPEVVEVDMNAVAGNMATLIVSSGLAAGVTFSAKEVKAIDDNCYNLLLATDEEVATEEWGMHVANALGMAFVVLDVEDVTDEERAMALDVNEQLAGVLVGKYSADKLTNRYTSDELKDLIATQAADKYSLTVPADKQDDLGDIPANLPEGALCELVVDVILIGADMVQSRAAAQLAEVARIAEEAMVDSASSTKAAPTEPVTKVKITSGEGHTRETIDVDIVGDLRKGGEIRIVLPLETLRVITLHDHALEKGKWNSETYSNPKVVLNRELVEGEVVSLADKERLIGEAFGLRDRGGYEQAGVRIASMTFDFDLRDVSQAFILTCHHGLGYLTESAEADQVTKTNKKIRIVESWWGLESAA